MVFHSTILVLVGKLAFIYFKKQPYRAQLICFILLGNEEIRSLNMHLFNDSLVTLYILLSIVAMIQYNRPLVASCFMTLAVSIKVGALLLVPSFLGWIQYMYGPNYLLTAIGIILGFQIGIAMPFCNDSVAYMLGMGSAKTPVFTYLENAMFIRHHMRAHGAEYQHSTHWSFIDDQIFNRLEFVELVYYATLAANTWFFFIRKGCLIRCIENLQLLKCLSIDSGSLTPYKLSAMTHRDRLKGIQLMVICYVTGCQLIPGAH